MMVGVFVRASRLLHMILAFLLIPGHNLLVGFPDIVGEHLYMKRSLPRHHEKWSLNVLNTNTECKHEKNKFLLHIIILILFLTKYILAFFVSIL